MPLAFCLTLTLTGCNIFENQNHNNNSDNGRNSSETVIKYTASDIKYYTQAGEEICTNSSGRTTRTYYKAYDGFCAVALANIGDYFGPVLVGEDAAQVCFSQSYDSTIIGSGGSIIYDGVEYFYSRADYFLSGYLDGKEKYPNYFSKQTTLEEVAKEIASLATFEKVSDSLKKEFIFTELVDGTLSVKAGPYCQGKEEIVIPSTFEGKTVSEIESESFQNLTTLKVLRFAPNSKIKEIGYNAFRGCTNLKYAVIPQSVTKIGNRAFESCSSELMIYCEAETRPSGYYESQYGSYWYGSADMVWYGMVDYIETENYKFGVKIDGTLSISKYLGSDANVVIPENYNGKSITSIGGCAFEGKNRMKSVTLPSTLTRISWNAFENCSQLKEIHVPNKVTEIGENAFQGCTNLKYAVIPQSVTKIGNRAFESCSSELMIYCEAETRPSGYYESQYGSYWYGSADMVWYGMVDYIETDEYRLGVSIYDTILVCKYIGDKTSVTIPNEFEGKRVTRIGKYAFFGFNRITDITLPSDLETIGSYAFANCTFLKEIRIPDRTTTIYDSAFQGCSNLIFAFIPQSVTKIGNRAFESCSSELMIYCEAETRPSGYYESQYGSYWYGSADMVWYGMVDYIETENYKFGVKIDGTLSISKYLGSDANVVIPENYNGKSITSIGGCAFEGKNRMKSVTLPSTLTRISWNAFENCSQLKEIHVPNKVTEIGENAFQGCTNLKYAVIPQSVTKIGNRAFESCSSELMIYCEAETRPSGYYESQYGSYWYGSADKVWYGTTDYVETENYQFGIKIDGSYIITKYLGSETEVFVPGEIDNTAVSEIGRYSFAGKNRITKLTIPNTIYKIGNYAFNKCSFLNDVTLSPYLKEIDEYAFSSCSRLNQIIVPKSVTKIGNRAFESCSSDLKIFCEVSSRPSGYYESQYGSYWYGSGKPYYAGQWAYDKNGNPYVKK